MTFEHWWASITEAERNILTEGYARYVWTTAQMALRTQLKEAERKSDDEQLQLL